MSVVVVLVVLGAYALGTFPTALLVGKARGFDPTASGSGNPGASNTTRIGGWKAGALVFAGDAGKGAIAAGVGYAVDGRTLAWLAGAAAVVGHVWPLQRALAGGKGVATAGGVGLVCALVPALVLLACFALLVRISGKAAIGSLITVLFVPVAVALAGQTAPDVVISAGISLVIIARHQSNIRRLLAGTESGLTTEPETRD